MEPKNSTFQPTPPGQSKPKRLLEVRCNGSFVYKTEIRQALNLERRSHWNSEIQLLKATCEGFWETYQPYLHRTQVTTEIVRTIIETILKRAGEDIELKFCWAE